MELTFIDLFCGIGGFRIAFEREGCKCVFSSDIDKYACQSYEVNFGDYPTGDITQVKSEDIPDFDILTGGFPCQSFSIAGKRRGFEDTRGTLFFDVARIIRDKQPAMFLLENVKGLISHDEGRTLDIILSTLAKTINGERLMFMPEDCLNYNVFYKVLNTKNFGLPQNRERIFIVGFKDDVKFKFPKSKPLKLMLKDLLESEVEDKYIIKNPKVIQYVKDEIKQSCYYIMQRPRGKNNGGTHEIAPCLSSNDYQNNNVLYKIMLNHTKGNIKQRIQSADKESWAVEANSGKQGIIENNVIRRLTPRECFRLQGFPDSYKFVVSDNQLYKQAGNSVSIPVVRAIAKQMLKAYNQSKESIC